MRLPIKLNLALGLGFLTGLAANRYFEALHGGFPEYSYRETALNPTNPRDRALDWEADLINVFRAKPELTELLSSRPMPEGRYVNLARPIRADTPCLVCHGSLEAAPASLIQAYGRSSGFGWKLNEVVGAQIVSVPLSVALKRAAALRILFMEYLAGVFVLLAIPLNALLYFVVLRPIAQMSRLAVEVSMGKSNVPEFAAKGGDEIASLAASFNRMRRSLEQAIRMLDRSGSSLAG